MPQCCCGPSLPGRMRHADGAPESKQKLGTLGLKPQNIISFILGTLDRLGSAEPSMSWFVVEVGK